MKTSLKYYVLLKEQPIRSIKIAKRPDATGKYRLVGEFADIVEATEAKLALRQSFKEWAKSDKKWERRKWRMRAMSVAPAFKKYHASLLEKHDAERPKKPA